jgi:hypothetical protein
MRGPQLVRGARRHDPAGVQQNGPMAFVPCGRLAQDHRIPVKPQHLSQQKLCHSAPGFHRALKPYAL